MSRRKSIKTETSDYIKQALGCGVVFYSASAGMAYYGDGYFDLVWPGLAALSAPIIMRVLDSPRLKMRPATSFSFGYVASRPTYQVNKRDLFQSLVKWSDGGYNPEPEPDRSNSYKIRYNEPSRQVFEWYVQLANRLEPVRVDEDDLHGFVSEVSKRQRQGKYSPLSRPYFTQRRRPPIAEPEYRAMVEILKVCNLIANRSQGASGKLRTLQPYGVVWYAKQTFDTLPH